MSPRLSHRFDTFRLILSVNVIHMSENLDLHKFFVEPLFP